MISARATTLIFGPIVLVGLSYWLTLAGADAGRRPAAAPRITQPAADGGDAAARELSKQCRATARRLAAQLGAECRILVEPPYVIAGDLSEESLKRHYRETIEPTARALAVSYFDARPDAPISILLFSDEATYRDYASQLADGLRTAYYGFYQRDARRIILNIDTGSGTLAHELTHALAHFDFPTMPEWFDEGLASLHEQCTFTEDGLQLRGSSNWRLRYLLPAVRDETLRPLREMIASTTVRSEHALIDYAQARYFCLYLQSRGLLCPFYRKFRARAGVDATGETTLRELLGEDLADVDAEFRQWVLAHD